MSYHYTNTNSYGGLGQYYGFGDKNKNKNKKSKRMPFKSFLQTIARPGMFIPKSRPKMPAMPKMPATGIAKLPPLRPIPVKDAAPERSPSDILPVSVASKAKAAAVMMEEDEDMRLPPGFIPPGLMKMPPASSEDAGPEEAVIPDSNTPSATKVIPMAPGYMMPGMMPPPPMRPGRLAPPPKPVITPQQARLGTIAAALGAGLLFF